MRRLEQKILVGVLLILIVAFGGISYVFSSKIKAQMIEQEKQKAAFMATTIQHALAKNRVAHRPEGIRDLIKELGRLEGIERLQIIRTKDGNGAEAAFADLKQTQNSRERSPGNARYIKGETRPPGTVAGIEHPDYRNAFRRILKDPYRAGDEFYLEAEGEEQVLTYLRPLPNAQECSLCHTDDPQLLGVLMVTSKMTNLQGRLADQRRQLFWISLGSIFVVGIILKVSMHRGVIAPIREVAKGINDAVEGQCDLSDLRIKGAGSEFSRVVTGIHQFTEKMQVVMAQVSETAGQVSLAVQEVLNNTNLITKGSEGQTESIESTFQGITHMNGSIDRVNGRVTELATLSEGSKIAVTQIASKIEEIAGETGILFKSVEGVSSAMMELSTSTHQINENVGILANSAEETTASSVEIDRIIEQIRSHLHSTVEMSNLVTMNAKHGEKSVDLALEGIQGIKEYSEEIYTVIHRLQKKMEDIGKILEVIAEVAEQTNLLSLNASIIAAQSGEQGKGFAVVAREIKELSERTSTSTNEIHEIIVALQTEGSRAVQVIEEASTHVEEGVVRSQGARQALGKIMESSQLTAQQITEVARATDEQSKGVQRVTEEMQKVNEMIKQIARTTAEQTKSSKLVIENTEHTRQIAGRVKLATQEQAKGNHQIQRLVEDINHRVQEIAEVGGQQKKECLEILKAMEDVRTMTLQNMDAVGRVGYAVENLLKQSTYLEGDISRFKK